MSQDGRDQEAADSLPPSCRFILDTLADEQPLTLRELVDETGMPRSTVKWAVRRLKNRRKVTADTDPTDLRRDQYKIHPDTDV